MRTTASFRRVRVACGPADGGRCLSNATLLIDDRDNAAHATAPFAKKQRQSNTAAECPRFHRGTLNYKYLNLRSDTEAIDFGSLPPGKLAVFLDMESRPGASRQYRFRISAAHSSNEAARGHARNELRNDSLPPPIARVARTAMGGGHRRSTVRDTRASSTRPVRGPLRRVPHGGMRPSSSTLLREPARARVARRPGGIPG
jgi:hypothetical protein